MYLHANGHIMHIFKFLMNTLHCFQTSGTRFSIHSQERKFQEKFKTYKMKEYENLSTPGGFLSVPEHTGLILCADGVQLFKSAKHSIWPILLAVTSLPPSIRMDAENFILAE